MKKLSAYLILLLILAPYSYAETYKWKDSAGHIHYSDVPPTSGKYESLSGKKPLNASGSSTDTGNAQSAPPPPSVSIPQGKPRQSDDVNPIVEKAKEADKKRQEAEAKEEEKKRMQTYCDDTKVNLEKLQSGDGVYMTSETGERSKLDAETIEKEIDKAQKFIEKNCK